tara:strand:+ start:2722 stop:3216 length:495 start_codon:yes stop_codon:yes gene_type:complete
MPVDNIFLTGKIALFEMDTGTAGTGTLPVTTATIATKIETPESSSYASGGYTNLVLGIQSAEITVEILYDKVALPPIFAGMKADIQLSPTGGRTAFLASSPTSTQASLATNEYKAYAGDPLTFIFENCTITQVTYDMPVKDLQKVKLTLVPSATPTVNFGLVAF